MNDINTFKIGDKVVPHSKSIGCSLKDCTEWNEEGKKQGFLYVMKKGRCDGKDIYMLKSFMDSLGSNYYLPQDLKPYVEEDEKIDFYDIKDSITVENCDCEAYSIELNCSDYNLVQKALDGESLVVFDISYNDSRLDPHLNFKDIKRVYKMFGDIIKFVEQETKPKEMTLEEIEKELGFKVVIKG